MKWELKDINKLNKHMQKENKVYIVMRGYYSDKRVERAFSKKNLAKEYCDRFDDECYIEEYVLDEEIPPRETSIFAVRFKIGKKDRPHVDKLYGEEEYKNLIHVDMNCLGEERLSINVESDSKDKAIKIASERYGMILANEGIRYPYLRKINKLSLSGPYYNFETGEIVII